MCVFTLGSSGCDCCKCVCVCLCVCVFVFMCVFVFTLDSVGDESCLRYMRIYTYLYVVWVAYGFNRYWTRIVVAKVVVKLL